MSLPAFTDDEDFKLMSRRREVKNAADITDIIDLVTEEYASFLECDIFKGIVRVFKLDRNEDLDYPKHLEEYIKIHMVSELTEINTDPKKERKDEKTLILKFDIKLSSCKLATIRDLKNAIAEILGLMPSALRLRSVEEGCLVVAFLIPDFVANGIFSGDKIFTLKQVQQFQKLPLLWLKCGNFEFPFRCLKDTDTEGWVGPVGLIAI